MLQFYYYTIAMQVYSTYAPIYKIYQPLEKKNDCTTTYHSYNCYSIVLLLLLLLNINEALKESSVSEQLVSTSKKDQ